MRLLANWLWRLSVRARRFLFFTAVVLWVGLVVLGFSGGLFRGPADGLTSAVCALFVLLAVFAAMAWTLRLLGFLVSGRVPEETEETTGVPTTPTALVMPIYHEDVARVALGIERIWRSAKASGLSETCDFFVLSDSTDPEVRLEEERACARLLAQFEPESSGSGRLFLVRRSERTGYKAGNVANFLRLHGADYEFMLVLDADAIDLSPPDTGGIAALPKEGKRTWTAPTSCSETPLGRTRLRIPWVGEASTQATDVTQGLISAQWLLMGIGILFIVWVAAVRYGFAG
jgi:membrane glycosyltransferase